MRAKNGLKCYEKQMMKKIEKMQSFENNSDFFGVTQGI